MQKLGKKLLAVAAVVAVSAIPAAVWAAPPNQIPQPPVAELIPTGPAMFFGLFNLALIALSIGYMLWEAARTRSVLPLAIVAGTCLAGLTEPIFDGNIHVMFAEQGQPPNWHFYNVGYPWYVVPGNGIMSAPIYLLYK